MRMTYINQMDSPPVDLCISNSIIKQHKTSELFDVLEILILYDKDIYCVTNILFELCVREFQHIINSHQNFYTENTNLNRLTNLVEELFLQRRLSKDIFNSLCKEIISNEQTPLELIWWLDHNNLYYFEDYWATKSVSDIISQLKEFVSLYIDNVSSEQNEKRQRILQDIFIKLFLVFKSQSSSFWFVRIQNIYEYYLEDAIEQFVLSRNVKLIYFLKVLRNCDTFYCDVIKDNCRNIIVKLLNYKENRNIFQAIEKQEQWTCKILETSTTEFYCELTKRFTLEELLQIISEMEVDKLNFYFALVLITALTKIQNCFKLLKSIIYRNLQSLFSDETSTLLHCSFSEISQTLFSLCLIRQSCLEEDNPTEVYSEWFVSTLGCNSILKCGLEAKYWALMLGALVEALPHEPAWVLHVHGTKALRAPSLCNKDAQSYRDACKNKLNVSNCSDDFVEK